MTAPTSTSAVIAHTSTATMDTWINEVGSSLVTGCGLTRMSALQDSGQMAFPSTTAYSATINTAVGYYMFYFTDPLALGPLNLAVLTALTAGTGYNGGASGTFTGVNLSGGTGTGGKATVVVGAAGVLSSITVTTAGTGYSIGDQITITSANMVTAGAAAGGGSSGFAFVGSLNASVATAVIKFEFGTGAGATSPQMWVTVGTSWASNGTLGALTSGVVTTRGALTTGGLPLSAVTQYTSRFIYNNILGYLGMAWKAAGIVGANTCLGGVIISRSNDSSGNVTGVCLNVYTNSVAAAGATTGGFTGCLQSMSYAAATVNPVANQSNSPAWIAGCGTAAMPFNATTTLISGNAFFLPCYYATPTLTFSAFIGVALLTEQPIGTTVPAAMIGATNHTFISAGQLWGSNGFGGVSSASTTVMMLWE